MVESRKITEDTLQRTALDLYGRVWPWLPGAIAEARCWGSDWFEVSTPSFVCEGERMIAHAGQVWCDLIVDGEPTRVAALHGILVDPEYRGRGHARAVIDAALRRLDDAGVDRVILWSEKIDFYARFGFRPTPESAFRCGAPAPADVASRPLDLDQHVDVEILRRLLAARTPLSSRYAAADDGWHFWIDCAIDRPDPSAIRYLPDANAIVIGEALDASTLRIADVIAPELPDLSTLVGAFGADAPFDTVELLFSPDRFTGDARPAPHPIEEILQVRGADLRPAASEAFALSPFTRT